MARTPPGPTGHFLLGSMLDFKRDQLGFLNGLAREYGNIAHFRLLHYHIYLLGNPDYIQEVLVTQQHRFEKGKLDKDILGKFLGRGLLTSEGEFHKKQRRLAQPAFHARRVEAYADVMVRYTLNMLESWQGQALLDVDHEMMRLTMAIVSKTLFDAEVDSAADKVGQAIGTLQAISNEEYRVAFSPPEWLPLPRNRRRKAARAVLDEVVLYFINERRASGEDKGDLLSMLLLAEDEDGQRMDDRQVRDEAVTLFAAGHETTSNALTWTFYLLSQHPEVEARLYAEIEQALAGRAPTLQDLRQLPYTEMVIKEAMRLYPPAWILNGRLAMDDVQIDGYAIPKGGLIFISPYVMHRDPRYFAEPERFNPERFSAANEKNIPRYAYLPFGGGPRVCIGNSFAMMEAQLILATMVQRLRLSLAAGQVVEPQPYITMGPKNGLKMQPRFRESARAAAAAENARKER